MYTAKNSGSDPSKNGRDPIISAVYTNKISPQVGKKWPEDQVWKIAFKLNIFWGPKQFNFTAHAIGEDIP